MLDLKEIEEISVRVAEICKGCSNIGSEEEDIINEIVAMWEFERKFGEIHEEKCSIDKKFHDSPNSIFIAFALMEIESEFFN